MFGVDTNCPYFCTDCYELGCEYCALDAQLEQCDREYEEEDEYEEDEYEEDEYEEDEYDEEDAN